MTSKPVRTLTQHFLRSARLLPLKSDFADKSNSAEICILSMHYPPEPTGNAPYSGALAAGLAAAGHHVTVHAAHPHYPEWKIYDGYGGWRSEEKCQGVKVQRRLHYVPQPPRGIRRLISELSFGLRLAFARWGSPKVVIALSPPLFAAAVAMLRLRLSPHRPGFVVWVQDIYSLGLAETGQGGKFVQRVTRWVEGHTLRAADRVVVLHERFADFLTGDLGIPASKVVVLRNWTHLPPSDSVDPTAARAALGWPEGVTLAVHTGNMGAKQGLENVVDAARLAEEMNSPVHFILVGAGSEREALQVSGRGCTKLTFVDPLDDQDFRLALGAADVLLVNEKLGVSEMAMPSKLTSYFDAGRPVVAATDLRGITASEIAAADGGVVVDAGDPAKLLDAILALRNDPDAAAQLGLNGRRHRETNLDQGQAIAHWDSLLAEVLMTRRQGHGAPYAAPEPPSVK